MSDQYNDEFDAPVSEAPPTTWQAEPTPSTWPTVIGVIGIVVSIIGLLMSTCTLAVPLGMPMLKKFAEGQPDLQKTIDQVAADTGPLAVLFVLILINMALCVYWLIGSIKLLKRRPSAIGMLRIYAVLEIVRVVLGTGWTVMNQMSVSAVQSTEGVDATQAQAEQAMQTVQVISTVCIGLPLSLIIPVFMLIWFSRQVIKADVATWDGGAASGYDR